MSRTEAILLYALGFGLGFMIGFFILGPALIHAVQ